MELPIDSIDASHVQRASTFSKSIRRRTCHMATDEVILVQKDHRYLHRMRLHLQRV